MIVGALLCTECGIVLDAVNPNGGGRICLDCGNWHIYSLSDCVECESNNTKEMLYLSAKDDEICPKCRNGLLRFCI